MDFEKYADFSINFPFIIYSKTKKEYLSGSNYSFSDFMNGKKLMKLTNDFQLKMI